MEFIENSYDCSHHLPFTEFRYYGEREEQCVKLKDLKG